MAGQLDMSEFPPPAPGVPDPVELAELAVATRTPLLLTGLTSGYLTMLARRITTIMPPLRYGEYAIKGDAPLRSPHSSISRLQLAREAEDARGGVLYIDEVEDFKITRDFIETLSRVLAGPNPPLLVASMLWRPMENSKLSARIKRLADRGLEFPLQVDVRVYGVAIPGRSPDRASAAIRARIESYDPENRLIAHDLVAEGKIDDAWKILRGEVVERPNPGESQRDMPVRRLLAARTERCTPRCPGWYIFDVDRDPGVEIEVCDECNLIAEDRGEAVVSDDDVAELPEAQDELAAQLHALEDTERRNPDRGGSMPPTPSARALKMYTGFHQRDPKKVGTFHAGLKIPATAMLVGDAVHVLYKSDKLNPTTGIDEGWIDYIHEHKAGVKVYRCDRNAGGPAGLERRVPQWIQNVTELEWLGQCKGFAFADDDGVHEAKGTRPYPELFTTTNGKALLVIQNKRTLLAIIWGGKLGVEPRGIVN